MSRLLMDDAFVYDANDKGPSNRPFSIGRRLFKGGGGGGNQTVTNTVTLPNYVQPYAEQLMQRSADMSNQGVPQYGGQLTAGLNEDHERALQGIRERAVYGSPDINAARSNLTATMQGQYFKPTDVNPYLGARNAYAGPNPYIDQAIQKTQGDISRSYAAGTGAQTLAQFRNAGAFGGSAMQETQDMQNRALGDALSNASSQMRMQDYGLQQQISAQDLARNSQLAESQYARGDQNYNAERQRQIQGMMFAPQLANTDYQDLQALLGVGDIRREASQANLSDAYQKWLNQVNAPYQQLETLASGIQGATGGGIARNSTSMNPYQTNRTASAIGGGLAGAGLGSMMGGGSGWGSLIGGGLGLLGGLFG